MKISIKCETAVIGNLHKTETIEYTCMNMTMTPSRWQQRLGPQQMCVVPLFHTQANASKRSDEGVAWLIEVDL